MPLPITFTEQENRHLQSTFIQIQQDAQQVQYYPNTPDILAKLEVWPVPATFTEQESREIQVLYEHFKEVCVPFQPLQARELTFGQPTITIQVVESILGKLEAAQ